MHKFQQELNEDRKEECERWGGGWGGVGRGGEKGDEKSRAKKIFFY